MVRNVDSKSCRQNYRFESCHLHLPSGRSSMIPNQGEPMEITGEWFAGFCDGECSIGIAGHGGSLQPRFRLNQRDDDSDLLRYILAFIGVGTLHAKHDSKNPMAKPQTALIVVGADCKRIVDIFDKFPLRSKKRHEYPHWKKGVEIYSSMLSTRWKPGIVEKRGELLEPLKVTIEVCKIYKGKT